MSEPSVHGPKRAPLGPGGWLAVISLGSIFGASIWFAFYGWNLTDGQVSTRGMIALILGVVCSGTSQGQRCWAEMFGQEPVRRKWKREHGRWHERIDGLILEDYLARLRDDMMPLVERFQRMAQRNIDAHNRKRNKPAIHLEQLKPLMVTVRTGTSRE